MVLKKPMYDGKPAAIEAERSGLAELEDRVAMALADTGVADAARVEVVALPAGEVVLTGYVTTPAEVGRCSAVALQVDGVTLVNNRVWVTAGAG